MATQFNLPKAVPLTTAAGLYPSAKLYFYVTGTSTDKSVYTDAALGTPHAQPVVADANGFFAPIWLANDVAYRVTLKTSAGATVNGYPVDGVGGPILAGDIGSAIWPITSAEQAASVTPTNYGYPPGDVRRYGADPTGVADSAAAWNAAIAQCKETNGNPVVGPGTYLVKSTVLIDGDNVKMLLGETTFNAGTAGMIVVKLCANECEIGSFHVNGNGKADVEGIVLAPSNESDTGTVSQINFNRIGPVWLYGLKEGIRLRCGPTVSATDSGIYYNEIRFHSRECIRSVWMQDTINTGAGGPNGNFFPASRAGSSGTACNTGFQIDCGADNRVYVDFEGMANGTTPNTTPTAIVVKKSGANGADNNNNTFFFTRMEANTRNLDNRNSTTQLYSGNVDATSTKWACSPVISTITRSTVTATVTTATAHGLASGQRVRMYGQTPSGYRGSYPITVTAATTFTYVMPADPGGSASVVGNFHVDPGLVIGSSPSVSPVIVPGMNYSEGLDGMASGYWQMTTHFAPLSYKVADLPSADPGGRFIYVSNETGGATMAFSDGTNWRRVQDRVICS